MHDILFSGFSKVEGIEAHRETMKRIGRGIGGDKPLISILYAIAFYESTKTDLDKAQISSKDKDVIFKAMDHLSVVYRRFLKNIHGWKIASSKLIHQEYYMSLLKENVMNFNKVVQQIGDRNGMKPLTITKQKRT